MDDIARRSLYARLRRLLGDTAVPELRVETGRDALFRIVPPDAATR